MHSPKIYKKVENGKYYNPNPLLECKANLLVALGGREVGKSFAFVITKGDEIVKNGRCFVIVRRYDRDVQKVKKNLYKHYKEIFPDDKIRVYGDEICRNDKRIVIFMGLNASSSFKSTDFDGYKDVDMVIFDEFVPEPLDIVRSGEVKQWYSIMSTIGRGDEWKKFVLVGNTITKHCPILENLNQNYIIPNKAGYIYEYPEVAFEYVKNSAEVNEAMGQSAFGQLAQNDADYWLYAQGKKAFVNDNDFGIEPTRNLEIVEWKYRIYSKWEKRKLDIGETIDGNWHIDETTNKFELEYGDDYASSSAHGCQLVPEQLMKIIINRILGHKLTWASSSLREATIKSLMGYFKVNTDENKWVWKIKRVIR